MPVTGLGGRWQQARRGQGGREWGAPIFESICDLQQGSLLGGGGLKYGTQCKAPPHTSPHTPFTTSQNKKPYPATSHP